MTKKTLSDPSLILHPIRVRIVYAIEGRSMTSHMIAQELPDVPQASLYRHIKKLVDARVLLVVAQRQVHGTVERTYQVDPGAVFVDPKKFASSRDKSIRYFEVFLSCLRSAFARYSAQPGFDLKKDGATFSTEFAYLSDDEQIALNQAIRELILTVTRHPQEKSRRRRSLSFVALPEAPAPRETTSPPTL